MKKSYKPFIYMLMGVFCGLAIGVFLMMVLVNILGGHITGQIGGVATVVLMIVGGFKGYRKGIEEALGKPIPRVPYSLEMVTSQATRATYRKCRKCRISFHCPIGGNLYYCDNCLPEIVDTNTQGANQGS